MARINSKITRCAKTNKELKQENMTQVRRKINQSQLKTEKDIRNSKKGDLNYSN